MLLNHRLNSSRVLQHLHVKSGTECIYLCLLKHKCCRSVNYRKNDACNEMLNCELLHDKGTDAERSGLLTPGSNFDHYVLLQPNRVSEDMIISS